MTPDPMPTYAPMHEVKLYVVAYTFFGYIIHHRGSKMTVASPCVFVGHLLQIGS